MRHKLLRASIVLFLLLVGTWATAWANESPRVSRVSGAKLRGRLLPDDVPGGPLD